MSLAVAPRTSGTVHLAMRAMSTDVTITVVGGDDDLLAWARGRIEQLEARWSRFLPDSDISRLNAADGRPVEVTNDTLLAVRAACAAWVHTAGAFDPTVHDSLLRLGYDESIEQVRRREADSAAPTALFPSPGCAGIVIDDRAGRITLPVGVRLDLGGIGKGLAADLTAEGLCARGATGALVDIGGDLRVTGDSPRGGAWLIDIEDPRDERPIATVELFDGGVATSTTLRRRWRSAHETRHHIVEPSTGSSTSSSVVGAAVVAGTAGWADALSKVPFVAPSQLDRLLPASCIVMFEDGTSISSGPMEIRRRPVVT
ncbi:MAG: FAD:protein FMN transferase [Ilumatobacteraceae bacterium]